MTTSPLRPRTAAGVALILMISLAGTGSLVSAKEDDGSVRLLVGRSAVVNMDSPIARVSLTSADIADAMVTQPNQLLIQGKLPGTISMFVWDRGGVMRRYDVTVERDLSGLTQRVRELFPAESISVQPNGKAVVMAGIVSSKYIAEKAIEVAAGYVDKKEDVVSLLQVREVAPPQVLLRVRFAEVSRSALTELGVSLFTGPDGFKNFVGRSTTQQFSAPIFDDKGSDTTKLVFSDFLNLFVFDLKNQLGGVIRALQNRGLFQSLAEPNLVAESGKDASFLAGGEIPIPVAQAGAGNLAITVMWKEFGVRLNFTPTVTGGDRVRLKVRPEVSTLDFSNAIVLQGFRIPALSTRRTETEVELQDGQTFAIAGLLNNTATQSLQKIPGIGDIPILGYLFRSKAAQKNQTELVVMITPQILKPGSSGVTDTLPRQIEPYLPPQPTNRSFPAPPPAFVPRPAGADAAAAPAAVPPPAAVPTAAAGAAVLTEMKPKLPTIITQAEVEAARTTPPPASAPVAAPASTPAPATPSAPPPTPEPTATDAVPAISAPAAFAPTELSPEVKKVIERERAAQRKREEQAAREQANRDQLAAEQEMRRVAEEQKKQAREAREQARRDQKAAQEAAKQAEKQAEIDARRQKAIDDAAARLKTAEAAYQAELAKKSGSQR